MYFLWFILTATLDFPPMCLLPGSKSPPLLHPVNVRCRSEQQRAAAQAVKVSASVNGISDLAPSPSPQPLPPPASPICISAPDAGGGRRGKNDAAWHSPCPDSGTLPCLGLETAGVRRPTSRCAQSWPRSCSHLPSHLYTTDWVLMERMPPRCGCCRRHESSTQSVRPL